MRNLTLVFGTFVMSVVLPHVAYGQSLRDRLVGAWTLLEGSEVGADGKKVIPWAKGSLIIEKSGHLSLFVLAKDRAKNDNVRMPAGPMVAWYGTYTVDEIGKKCVIKIEGSTFVPYEGTMRVQTVTFSGDTLTTVGNKVVTPEGEITPMNVWKKVD